MITRDGEGGIWFRPRSRGRRYRLPDLNMETTMSRKTIIALSVGTALAMLLAASAYLTWIDMRLDNPVEESSNMPEPTR